MLTPTPQPLPLDAADHNSRFSRHELLLLMGDGETMLAADRVLAEEKAHAKVKVAQSKAR